MMKTKGLLTVLIFSLIFTLFTACGETPESPTDAIASAVESVVNKEVAVDENSAVSQQEESVVSKEDSVQKEPAQTVSSQTPASSVSSKVSVSSTPSKVPSKPATSQPVSSADTPATTPSQDAEGLVADIVVEYPTFTKESALKDWLLGKHPDYFADKRNDMLSTMGNQGTVTYYKPSVPANHSLFAVSQVEVHTPSGGMNYFFNGTGEESELVVLVNNRDTTAQGFGKIEANRYAGIKSYCLGTLAIPEGIIVKHVSFSDVDFYCQYGSNRDNTTIVWQQFGLYQTATLQGHFDQIEQIIPLLYLQQVKVDNSAVIK